MRLFSLLSLSLWAASALGQDESTDEDLPPPGQPALTYTDGSFSEPNGGTASYNEGTRMNISWASVYETTSVYLIVGYDWASPIQLTTNSAQSWFQWDVTTDSTNSSQVYVFRGVNGTGTAEQKAVGGFLSAAFNIPVKDETTGPKQTFSTLSTSAGQPTQTSTKADASQTSPTTTNTPSQEKQDEGITQGAKIGIGVGVGVGVVGIAAFVAAFLFWKKSKKAKQTANPQPHEMPLNGDFSPRFPPQQQQQQQQQMYDASNLQQQQALAGHYKPPQYGETRGAELDGGQGYHFTAEANHDHMGSRSELQ